MRRTPSRRVEEKDVQEEILLQVEQVPQRDQFPIVEGGNDGLVVRQS